MGNNASDNDIGINLGWWANDNEITNNTVSNFEDGIRLFNSNRNHINNNTASFNNWNGIYIRSSSENNITNNNAFFNSGFGINLDSSDSNKLSGNILSNNKYAIYLFASIGNNLSDNIMLENGIYPNGNLIEHWNTHDIDTSNIVNGKPVYFWKNKTSGVIPSDAGQIILANCQNIKIETFELNNCSIGIHLGFSMFCNISYNNLYGNINGIMLSYSNWNIIAYNNASDNSAGIYIIYSSWNNISHNNVILGSYCGIVLVYSTWNNISGNNASSDKDDGIYLRYSDNNKVTANDVSNNTCGINLDESHINNITNNNASYNTNGIHLSRSNENHINNNNFSSNIYGIDLFGTSNINIFTGNIVLDNQYGISFYSSNGNDIIDNNISNNNRGIYLWSSSNNNIITENIVSSNTLWGIYFQSTSGNMIYKNNFINNTNQAFDDREDNYWDNGYPVGGNFWSDYNGNDSFKGPLQDQPGSDGIGDTNYSIDSDSIDNYPRMEPYADKPLENYTILKQGWNLISIPLIQNDQSMKKVLEMIDGYYDAIQWYNTSDSFDPWKHHKVAKPFGNDLFEVNDTMGFWIHITQPGNTIFLCNGTQPTSNQSIQLHTGWNMVGYPSLTNHNRTIGLNNLTFGDHVDAIWSWNAAAQRWEEMGESDNFTIGKGYYIHAKTKCEWEVPL
jgi:parallel beta-helix repeat protein